MAVQQILWHRLVRRSTCCHIGPLQCGEAAEPLAQGSVVGGDTRGRGIGSDREHILARLKGGRKLLGRWVTLCDLRTRGTLIAFGEARLQTLLHHRQANEDVERTGGSQPS